MFSIKFLRFLSWMAAILNGIVLVGWVLSVPALVRIDPSATPMSFSVAFGLFFASLGLALALDFKPRKFFLIPWLLILWGGGGVVAILAQIPFSLDAMFMNLMTGASFAPAPYLPMGTAFSVGLFGLALICLNRGRNYELIIAGSLSCFAGWLGLIGLLGRSFDTDMELTWGAYSQMNPPSAVTMLFLGFALPISIYLHHRKRNQFYAPAFNVALIFISLTVLFEQAYVRQEVQRNRQAVHFKGESIVWEIKAAFGAQYQGFRRMASRLERQTYDNYQDWAQDAEGYLRDFKGIRAISWTDSKYIVRWVYPSKDGWLSGKNLKLDADRYELLKAASLSHRDMLSQPLKLWLGGSGLLLVIPIYPQGRYGGALVIVYEFANLFPQILNLQGYSLEIFENDTTIYRAGTPDPSVSSRWASRQKIALLDRNWDVLLIPDHATLREQASVVPGVVLLFGLVISTVVCLAAYFYMSTREAERKTREVASWQTAIMQGSNFLIVSSDENLVIKSFNGAAEKLLGYKAEELVGRHTPMIWHDPEEIVRLDFWNKIRQQKTSSFECTYIAKNGQHYLMSLVVNPIFDDRGKITGFVGVSEDITEKRNQEEKMLTSARLSSLGEMAAGIAHEINNPLTIIGAHAASVRRSLEGMKEQAPEGVVKKMEAIERTVQRIAKIIRGLRSFAREVPDEQATRFSLRSVVDETLSFCSERFKNADIELIVSVDENLQVLSQEHQLSQVLLNLLNNAFDATVNSELRQVHVTAREVNGGVEIAVEDTGHGVPEELRQKIMQPFFTTKEVGHGLGLGLSISRGIIVAQGGQLTLDTQAGRTRFIIRLPS